MIERFFKFIVVTDSCWTWSGGRNKEGYGSFQLHGKPTGAHRVSYSIFNGNLIKGLVIDHICRNKSCVNPDHLRQVSHKTNAIENSVSTAYFNSIKTHCKRGHELTPDNIYKRSNRRECYQCRRDRAPIYKKRAKSK